MLWLLRQVISSGSAVARAVPPTIMLIQRAIHMIVRLGSQVNAARIQNAVVQTDSVEQSPGDNYAFMLTQSKGKRSAILYDPGCTAVMTNSLDGLIGSLSLTANNFVTAAGPKSFKQKGFMCKTIYGSDGTSVELRTVYLL